MISTRLVARSLSFATNQASSSSTDHGGGKRRADIGKQAAITEGAPDIRVLLVVLSALPANDVLLAAPVLVRDVYGVRDHGSPDSEDSDREKPLRVNSRAMRAHAN